MSHPKNRSERRFQQARIKQKFYRKQKLAAWWSTNERNAGLFANHGKVCSCYMCGNPRRYFNELTMQEKRALLYNDQP